MITKINFINQKKSTKIIFKNNYIQKYLNNLLKNKNNKILYCRQES